MDLSLIDTADGSQPSIYFDTKDKCNKWCSAINQILEQSQANLGIEDPTIEIAQIDIKPFQDP